MSAKKFPIRMIIVMVLIMAAFLAGSATAAVSSFSFTVSPQDVDAAPGSVVPYTMTITATPGFTDPIDFSMRVDSVGYSNTISLGTYKGPYPKTFSYNLQVPPQVPGGVSATVTVIGTSGSDQVTQTVNLHVKGAGGPLDGIISAITSALNSLLHTLGFR